MTRMRLSLSVRIAGLALLLTGCNQAPSASNEELQQKLIAAEARATQAEKRAKSAEEAAALHNQENANSAPPAAPPEIAENSGQFGQPLLDTAPIDPQPVVPAEPQQN